jgi:hypothetical protein
MGYSVVNVDDIEGSGAGPDGLAMVAVGARPGSYEPRGPF